MAKREKTPAELLGNLIKGLALKDQRSSLLLCNSSGSLSDLGIDLVQADRGLAKAQKHGDKPGMRTYHSQIRQLRGRLGRKRTRLVEAEQASSVAHKAVLEQMDAMGIKAE